VELNGTTEVFFGAMVGQLLLELLKISSWQDTHVISTKYRQAPYWLATCAPFLVAGIVGVLNGIDHIPLIRAVQLGVTAPAVVGAWATSKQTRRTNKLQQPANFMPSRTVADIGERITDLLAW
jgi:hypothetical protein